MCRTLRLVLNWTGRESSKWEIHCVVNIVCNYTESNEKGLHPTIDQTKRKKAVLKMCFFGMSDAVVICVKV